MGQGEGLPWGKPGSKFQLYVYVNVKYRRAMSKTYGIAELACEFGVTPRTIRFYEAEGLLAPLRDGQRRIYRGRDHTRLRLILRGRRLGFSLAEVREIVGLYDAPTGEAGQLAYLLDKIAARKADLEAKRRDIEASLDDLNGVAATCRARLAELDDPGKAARSVRSARR
jgi:DNA-binding transcriptional MerR regulator